jgi:hypothetical protein
LHNKHVLLITSTNLACNPRCRKELDLLYQSGAVVTVLAFNLHNWSETQEAAIRHQYPAVKFYYLDASRATFWPWLIASIFEKICRLLAAWMPRHTAIAAYAVSKRSWLLCRWVKKNTNRYHLVIAHNPAAFYAALLIGKQQQIPFALDIEDYHPGEAGMATVKPSLQLLMQQLIPAAAYTSFASPLIQSAVQKLLGDTVKHGIVVNNYFPSGYFFLNEKPLPEVLQLVWFSQNIDHGRGLEQLLPVMEQYIGKATLTLIGNADTDFCRQHIQDKKHIQIMASLPLPQLCATLALYDAGLALEPGKDENNNLALSNKILSYYQAGLYIVASTTPAQTLFLQQQPQHGICTGLTQDALTSTINWLIEHKHMLRQQKAARFANASATGWQQEGGLLLREWMRVLTD